ncbi:hypothetical protein ACKVMT_04930 [Halobacteriales archaeon Cl-PHB]
MTAVRLVDSAKYGFKLFAYLVVVTAVGGGAFALGATLAWPEVQALRGAGQAATTDLAAGGVLALLGAVVLLSGYFGSAYKLVADAVATGIRVDASPEPAAGAETATGDETAATATEEEPAEATEQPGSSTPQSVPGAAPTEPSVEDGEPAMEANTGEAEPTDSSQPASTAAGPAEAPDDRDPEPDETGFEPLEQAENPPEPTAEEIAFGTTPGGDEAEAETVSDEPEPEPEPEETDASGSVKPAARDAPSDPLGDRGD